MSSVAGQQAEVVGASEKLRSTRSVRDSGSRDPEVITSEGWQITRDAAQSRTSWSSGSAASLSSIIACLKPGSKKNLRNIPVIFHIMANAMLLNSVAPLGRVSTLLLTFKKYSHKCTRGGRFLSFHFFRHLRPRGPNVGPNAPSGVGAHIPYRSRMPIVQQLWMLHCGPAGCAPASSAFDLGDTNASGAAHTEAPRPAEFLFPGRTVRSWR